VGIYVMEKRMSDDLEVCWSCQGSGMMLGDNGDPCICSHCKYDGVAPREDGAGMSYDLIKRVCRSWIDAGLGDETFWENWPNCPTDDTLSAKQVLDHIEALERERDMALAAQSYTYIGKNMKPILARDLEDAKDAAEAKLAKAVEALRHTLDKPRDADQSYAGLCSEVMWEIRAALAELEGK
jgi:hypothetical protein